MRLSAADRSQAMAARRFSRASRGPQAGLPGPGHAQESLELGPVGEIEAIPERDDRVRGGGTPGSVETIGVRSLQPAARASSDPYASNRTSYPTGSSRKPGDLAESASGHLEDRGGGAKVPLAAMSGWPTSVPKAVAATISCPVT